MAPRRRKEKQSQAVSRRSDFLDFEPRFTNSSSTSIAPGNPTSQNVNNPQLSRQGYTINLPPHFENGAAVESLRNRRPRQRNVERKSSTETLRGPGVPVLEPYKPPPSSTDTGMQIVLQWLQKLREHNEAVSRRSQRVATSSLNQASRVPLLPAQAQITPPPSKSPYIDRLTGSICVTCVTFILGGTSLLSLAAAFMLGMQETDDGYTSPRWLPSWLNSDYLFCLSTSLFLILGIYMSLIPLLKHSRARSEARMLRWCCIWLSSFGSFVLAVVSVFVQKESKAGAGLLGGLGNATQVFVIFLSMVMMGEKSSRGDIAITNVPAAD